MEIDRETRIVRTQSGKDPWEGFLGARRAMRDRYPEDVSLEEIDDEVKAVRRSENQRFHSALNRRRLMGVLSTF